MILKSYEIQKKISDLLKYNLFLTYGENTGLKKDIKDIIKYSLKKKNPDVEIISFYETDVLEKEDNFYNAVYSGSLFSSKKIITVNNVTDKFIKIIEDILEKKTDSILIIESGILEKKSKLRSLFEKNTNTICIPCYLDNDRDLEIIARDILKKNNIILNRETINLLVEKSNQDRENIKNEIEKIKSYSYEKKKINLDEIKSIINFSGEHKSDVLINECLCGNISQFKKITSQLYLNSINQIFLLRILSNKIERLIKMKEFEKDYKNIDNLVNEIKPAIFWKEKPVIKKQLSLWNFIELKKVFNEISNIEFLCKKNPQLSTILSFNFFNGICKKANNFSSQYQ